MNDTQLDELLDQWNMSLPPDSLREDVRSAFIHSRPRRAWPLSLDAWRGVFAGIATAAVLSLVVITSAWSQSALWFSIQLDRPSWLMESNKIFYHSDGSAPNEYQETYVLVDGTKIALSDDSPDLPSWRKAALGLESMYGALRLKVAPSEVIPDRSPAEAAAWQRFVARGCVVNPAAPSTLVGRETILGHVTTVNQQTLFWQGSRGQSFEGVPGVPGAKLKITQWMAADLDCATVKSRLEREGPDGRLHLVTETIPTHITANGVRNPRDHR